MWNFEILSKVQNLLGHLVWCGYLWSINLYEEKEIIFRDIGVWFHHQKLKIEFKNLHLASFFSFLNVRKEIHFRCKAIIFRILPKFSALSFGIHKLHEKWNVRIWSKRKLNEKTFLFMLNQWLCGYSWSFVYLRMSSRY